MLVANPAELVLEPVSVCSSSFSRRDAWRETITAPSAQGWGAKRPKGNHSSAMRCYTTQGFLLFGVQFVHNPGDDKRCLVYEGLPRSLPLGCTLAQVPTFKVGTWAGRDLGIVPVRKTSEGRDLGIVPWSLRAQGRDLGQPKVGTWALRQNQRDCGDTSIFGSRFSEIFSKIHFFGNSMKRYEISKNLGDSHPSSSRGRETAARGE